LLLLALQPIGHLCRSHSFFSPILAGRVVSSCLLSKSFYLFFNSQSYFLYPFSLLFCHTPLRSIFRLPPLGQHPLTWTIFPTFIHCSPFHIHPSRTAASHPFDPSTRLQHIDILRISTPYFPFSSPSPALPLFYPFISFFPCCFEAPPHIPHSTSTRPLASPTFLFSTSSTTFLRFCSTLLIPAVHHKSHIGHWHPSSQCVPKPNLLNLVSLWPVLHLLMPSSPVRLLFSVILTFSVPFCTMHTSPVPSFGLLFPRPSSSRSSSPLRFW